MPTKSYAGLYYIAKGVLSVGLVGDQEVQVDKNITSVACVFLK